MLTKILGSSVAGLALACLALGLVINHKNGVIEDRDETISILESRQDRIIIALEDVTGNTNLKPDDAPKQIALLGQSLADAERTLSNQSKAIDNLTKERNNALAEAARQAALREGVIARSKELRDQLAERASEPVERERLEEELRRVQDMAYEGGL